MSEKVKAIVIKSNDRKEKDVNILLFSLEKGKLWATLKGVKSPKAKMKLAQNLFCFGEFVIEEGRTGKVVTGFEMIESFHEISEDIDKFFEASALLEVCDKMEFSSENDIANHFILTLKSLKRICFGKVRNFYVLNKFFLELFKNGGFPLYSEKCSCCGTKAFEKLYIDYVIGELVCISCRGLNYDEISKSTFLAMKIINNTDFDRLESIKLAQDSELALLKVLVKNFESHYDKRLKLIGILS